MGVLSADCWYPRKLGASHLPTKSMIDSKPVSCPLFQALDVLLSDFVKSLSPLQVWMLESCSTASRGIAHNDFWIIVLEDAQQTHQGWVAARLPGETKDRLNPEWSDVLAPCYQGKQVA